MMRTENVFDVDGVSVTVTTEQTARAWAAHHAVRAASATVAATKRAVRIMRAVMTVATRYVPWLAVVFTACLIIPGPFDELGALIVVAIYAAFKPAMRADIAIAFRTK
jgi:hypothetical protein